MKVIVLGKGYVGKWLTKGLNDLYTTADSITNVCRSEVDYTSIEEFDDYQGRELADCIINTTGYTGSPNVDACEANAELTWKLNVTQPLQIARYCEGLGIRFIHVGSGCIFNATGEFRLISSEDDPNFGLFTEFQSIYRSSKHACEENLKQFPCYQWRVRMPFSPDPVHKNYLWKLFKYDKLISHPNSLTSMKDIGKFAVPFINGSVDPGIYHAVNYGFATAADIVNLMKENGMANPNWEIVPDVETKVARSNCVLSTSKEKDLGIQMPPLVDSLMRDVKSLSECIEKESS